MFWTNIKYQVCPLSYSLSRPVVRYSPIQRDSVAEVGVVAVLLPQVFSVALLSWRQRGREAAFTPTPEALNQTQRFGQTWERQKQDYMSGSFSRAESLSPQWGALWLTADSPPPHHGSSRTWTCRVQSAAVKAGETSELRSHYDKCWHRFTQSTFTVQIYSTNRDVWARSRTSYSHWGQQLLCENTTWNTFNDRSKKKKRLQTVNGASRISLFETRDKISVFFVWLDVFVGGSVIKVTPSAWRAAFRASALANILLKSPEGSGSLKAPAL